MSPLTEPTKLTLALGQPVPNDPYLYTNTVLLLHGDGTNGSTNIVDSSRVAGGPKTVAPVGNAQISTAIADPFSNSTGVIAFDGNNDYLTVASSTALAFGTGDFTVEMFIRRVGDTNAGSGAAANIIDFRTAEPSEQFYLYVRPSGGSPAIDFRYFVNGADRLISTTLATANVWRHVAIVRSSNITRLFVDGIAEGGTWADPTNYTATTCVIGGRFAAISGDFRSLNGYIDDLRITKGVARYTSNFTPPTAPFPDF